MGILYEFITNKNYEVDKIKAHSTALVNSVESKQNQKPKAEGANEDEQRAIK